MDGNDIINATGAGTLSLIDFSNLSKYKFGLNVPSSIAGKCLKEAPAIIKPYVSKKTHWIIEKHGEFQAYYYAHHLGGDRNMRDKYKNHEYYQATIDFCEKYDQNSFDPNYKSYPLEYFKPMVMKIFSRKPYSHY